MFDITCWRHQTETFPMFSLIYAWTNGWANHRDSCDLRRHCAQCNVTAMSLNARHVEPSENLGDPTSMCFNISERTNKCSCFYQACSAKINNTYSFFISCISYLASEFGIIAPVCDTLMVKFGEILLLLIILLTGNYGSAVVIVCIGNNKAAVSQRLPAFRDY